MTADSERHRTLGSGSRRGRGPDGSAIVVRAQMARTFGFHRRELTDEALVETCADEGCDPRLVWPATRN